MVSVDVKQHLKKKLCKLLTLWIVAESVFRFICKLCHCAFSVLHHSPSNLENAIQWPETSYLLCVTLCRLSGLSPFSGSSDEETLINVAYSRYDAGDLLDGVSNEALKFLYKIMKLLPRSVQLSSRGYLHAQENPYELCACSTPSCLWGVSPELIQGQQVLKTEGGAQDLCDSQGGCPGLPVPDSPYGLCGHTVTLNLNLLRTELRDSQRGHPGLPIPDSPYGLCGRRATLNWTDLGRR